MSRCCRWVALVCVVFAWAGLGLSAFAQEIDLLEGDALVWLHEGTVEGDVSSGLLFVNDTTYTFAVSGDGFEADIRLEDGPNVIVACSADESVCSDTLRWTLGYELHPEPFAYAEVSGRTVTLQGRTFENPEGRPLTFRWDADSDNPAAVSIAGASDSIATVEIPAGAPPGEYYFDLTASDSAGKEGRARTLVTVDSTGVIAFDIKSDHAAWVDEAVVFEITPYIFEERGGLGNVLARLEEIADLGVNTIWLQPVFATGFGGQGYGITDYFEVREDYGTKADLRALVERAHDLGMRVLLDFVPNHTSSKHPFAQESADLGTGSHYYDYYLREEDNAPYSRHYKRRQIGNAEFIIYFWDNLLIIDHDNPEVQRWMIEAGRYWVEEFDIDGYRIDAVWGVNARTPEMMSRWRHALKRYKPEVLLLGEDKATEPAAFENRFDVAYDWFPGEGWVSRWTWQTDYREHDNLTFFNDATGSQRIELIRESLTNRGNGWHPDAKVLRFMENNDTFRFLEHHTVDQSAMAAAFLFSLPGIPLIYNGQEIGRTGHPYSSVYVYFPGRTIEQQSRWGLIEHYKKLIDIRAQFEALTGDNFAEVSTSSSSIYAYRRWKGDKNIFGVVNPNSTSRTATLSLPTEELNVAANQTYFLTDVVRDDYFEVSGADLASVTVHIPATSTRILVLDDQIVQVGREDGPGGELPAELALAQNYPNPFNPSTTITFSLPEPGSAVLRVYDVTGRLVKVLLNERMPAGRHDVSFDARDLASGVYIYRLEFGGRSEMKTMILHR